VLEREQIFTIIRPIGDQISIVPYYVAAVCTTYRLGPYMPAFTYDVHACLEKFATLAKQVSGKNTQIRVRLFGIILLIFL
jgi:hypothetical protein